MFSFDHSTDTALFIEELSDAQAAQVTGGNDLSILATTTALTDNTSTTPTKQSIQPQQIMQYVNLFSSLSSSFGGGWGNTGGTTGGGYGTGYGSTPNYGEIFSSFGALMSLWSR